MKLVSKLATTLLLVALMLSLMPASVQPVQASTCYWAQFVSDVTVPDGTTYAPGSTFTKTWRLKNIGTCAWSDVSLLYSSGEKMGAPTSSALPTTVNAGQTVDISVALTAPSTAGHYFGYFKFKSTAGGEFGIGSSANGTFWVEINVSASSGTGYDFTLNAPSAAWTSGAGSLTFPGTDGSASGFALKLTNPSLENGVASALAGLLLAPNNVTNGYIQGIYPAFDVISGDRFQATIGCEYGATSCYVANRLDYQIGSGTVKTFWTFREKYEGMSYNVNLDLSSLAGQAVKFILVTSAYGSPTGDRALWVNPVIVRGGSSTPTPTPTNTPTGTPPTPTPTSTGTTPTPTKTPTPGPAACDRAGFISDVTIPDGTSFAPNTPFLKTWRIKNIGSCTWTNYSLIFDTGDKMGGLDTTLIIPTILPGQTVDLSISLTSPSVAGSYRGYWKLKNNTGVPFGIGTGGTKSFWVDIVVTGPTSTPTPTATTGPTPTPTNTPTTGPTPTPTNTPTTGPTATPTNTSTPTPTFTPSPTATAVTGISYNFVSHVCDAAWYSAAGALPCPGSDGSSNGFVLTTSPSRLENGVYDGRAGLITFPQNVYNGYIQGWYPAYTVQPGDRFRSIINCEYGATSCYVTFRLDYDVVGGLVSVNNFWAFSERYEGSYGTADVDLSPLVGQNLQFILTVHSYGSATGDRALWVGPIIYNPASP